METEKLFLVFHVFLYSAFSLKTCDTVMIRFFSQQTITKFKEKKQKKILNDN